MDVEVNRVRVDFADDDLILKMLLEDIRAGRMADCCGIEERKDLEGYGRRLAAQLALYDASSPTPGWHHLRAPEPLPGTAPAGGRPPGAPVQGAGRAVE
ncbi:MAG: hypothetical protein D6718_07720 [Acidobacteria bacterium]|nr:MAG: hypothetical protein D6718_07720 [Acidobacteriota bacterium]